MLSTLDARIERDPKIVGGKPRIAGHRITVIDIVIWFEMLGRGADEIAYTFQLELADIYAALAYYHAHREEMDQIMKDDEELRNTLKSQINSKLGKKLGLD